LLYNDLGQLVSWGMEAKYAKLEFNHIRCEWFKGYLDPANLRPNATPDPNLPKLPVRLGRSAMKTKPSN
jgi:hypothetical protein